MAIHTFTKESKSWYIDFPEHLQKRCRETKMAMVEGANAILEKIANGDTEMQVLVDTREFKGAAVLELIELCETPSGGGYYCMRNCNGRVMMRRMWLCDIPLFIFGDIPQKIYLKKLGDITPFSAS